MKIYLLWFNEWEANNILGVFQTRQEAERWLEYFLANGASYDDDVNEGNEYDYLLSSLGHFATNGDLEDRLSIEECIVGTLNDDVKIDNLKLLEWEAKKNEEKNSQSLS